MTNNNYLDKLHSEILNILDEIVVICEKHNLKYYLIGGTLLGAIRHKGFIPWDDDLDIIMPREDYVKLTEQYFKELPPEYKLDWFNTNPNYNHIFAKIYNVNTLFEEELSENVHSKRGIFVDIFPMDVSNGYSLEVLIRKKIVNQINRLLVLSELKDEQTGLTKLLLQLFDAKQLQKMALFVMEWKSKKGGKYYSNFGSQYNIKRQTHPIVNFGSGVKKTFEDRIYNCPCNYEEVLTSIFGKNYMEIPPADKRRTHYPFRVKFSDGEEIFFGKVQNKIVVGKD